MKRLLPILRRAAQALLLLTISCGLTLLVAELAVRLVAPQQLIDLRPDIWQPTEGVGWRHRANADTMINTGDGPARIVTDDRGHRIAPPASTPAASTPAASTPAASTPAATPLLRVLALGDSFLEAIQVDHEDTFVFGLETRLTAATGEPARVVNTGVGGWGPDQYLIEARDELARQPHDAVLVFVYLPNDRVYRRFDHYPPRQAAERRGWRWPRSLTKGELVDAVAYPINDVLERNSHLFTLLKHRAKFLLMRLGLSAHYFPTALDRRTDAATPEAWTLTAEVLADIHRLAAAQGTPTLVVLLPGLYQVDADIGRAYATAVGLSPDDYDLEQPSRLLGQALASAKVPFVDLLPVLRAAHREGRGPLYGKVDTHLAPVGHAVVAEAILPLLVDLMAEPDD